MLHQQISAFTRGLSADLEPEKINTESYRDMVNMVLKKRGAQMAASTITSDTLVPVTLTSGHEWIGEFACLATYGPQKETRDSVLVFTKDFVSGFCAIHLLDIGNHQLYKIYDDHQAPVRERWEPLNIHPEIDCYTHGDKNQYWAYWVDYQNPLRYIFLHVENPAVSDNSIAPYSVLYIPNENDLLYVQPLFPVDVLEVSGVRQTGGGLKAGGRHFTYRYYNTKSGAYSTFMPIGVAVPVIQDNTDVVTTNDLKGYGPGSTTPKSIVLTLHKSHFHHQYFDAVQLAVVEKIGTDVPVVKLLSPSKQDYGLANSNSEIVYTGNEKTTEITVGELTIEDAEILTGKTLQEQEGRLFIGNVKYRDTTVADPTEWSAETTVQELSVSVDPMIAEIAAGKGYYDERNNYLYRGYFRDEVYRFARIYFTKFGASSRPKPLDFSALSYDPNNHATTWQKNWSSTGTDWKFVTRECAEGSLFSANNEAIRALGLQLTGLNNHPSWAYGMAVVRSPRVKNILGQTPVVNAAAIKGNALALDWNSMQDTNYPAHFWLRSGGWDYDGQEDTFVPKVFAMGHTKHLVVADVPGTGNSNNRYFYLGWELDRTQYPNNQYSNPNQANSNLVFLFPLEFLANDNGIEQSGIQLDGSESIKIIDAVLLESFNAFRSNQYYDGVDAPSFILGKESRYMWTYSPKGKGSYFYHTHNPYTLLDPTMVAGLGVDVLNVAPADLIRIERGYMLSTGHSAKIITSSLSSDERLQHVKKINNLLTLTTDQTSNENNLWNSIDLRIPGTVINPRMIAAVLEVKNTVNGPNYLADPTWFVYDKYVNGTGNYSTLFPGAQIISDNAVEETLKINDLTTISLTAEENILCEPTSGVPIFVANIVKGLSDDRYGRTDLAEEFLFTGAYAPLSESQIEENTPISLNVWGGDAFITRNIIHLRNNAPLKDKAKFIAPEDFFDILGAFFPYSSSTLDQFVMKTSTYETFVEILDLWVESTINGHYIYRTENQYPNGVQLRDPNHTDFFTYPRYEYPLNKGVLTQNTAPLYLYNRGYSAENTDRLWFSQDLTERILSSIQSRIHHSHLHVLNSPENGFSRWKPLDYFDLVGNLGGITALRRDANRRLLAIQTDGVASLFIGRTLDQDASGLTISLNSGTVVGYAQYFSDNSKTFEAGSQHLKTVYETDKGFLVLDLKRKSVLVIGEKPQSVSEGLAQEVITQQLFPGKNGDSSEIFAAYDSVQKRVTFFRNTETGVVGISLLTSPTLFESRWDIPGIRLDGIITHGGETFAFVKDLTTDAITLRRLYEVGNTDTLLGKPYHASVKIALNNGQHRDMGKVLASVLVNSNRQPTSLSLAKSGDGSPGNLVTNKTDIPFTKNRHNLYIANDFVDVSGQRFRAPLIEISVVVESEPEPMEITSIIVNYRLDTRHYGL